MTAIRAADIDGNPATVADPAWTPLIPTPPFPAYTSGHSTFSAAAAAVLADFFGTDEFAFTLESENPAAADRSFTSFSQAAEESGLSRIYGGIHWSFDNVQGLVTGDAVGHFVSQNELRPISRNGHAGGARRGGNGQQVIVAHAFVHHSQQPTRAMGRFAAPRGSCFAAPSDPRKQRRTGSHYQRIA